MILRTIKCSVTGCPNQEQEPGFNKGWPEWGHVAGVKDPETGETVAHICPFHKAVIMRVLNGDFDKVFIPTDKQILQFGGRQ